MIKLDDWLGGVQHRLDDRLGVLARWCSNTASTTGSSTGSVVFNTAR